MKKITIHFTGMMVAVFFLFLIGGCSEDSITDERKTGKEPRIESKLPTSAELLKKALYIYEQIDLLEGVTLKEGVQLIKVEISYDGKRERVADIHQFVPQILGYVTFYFTFSTPDKQVVEVSKQKFVNPQTYQKPVFMEVNVVNDYIEKYQSMQSLPGYFENATWVIRCQLAPYLPVCYIAREMYWSDAMVYIIANEFPEEGWDVETIGLESKDSHASVGCLHIRMMSPKAVIKAVSSWDNIEKYVNAHPEQLIFISNAVVTLGWNRWEASEYGFPDRHYALRRIMEKDNIILSNASGNHSLEINENEKSVDGEYLKITLRKHFFGEQALNSKKNNKIAAQGWPVKWDGYNYTPYTAEETHHIGHEYSGGELPSGFCDSSILYGFDNVTGNIVMPFFQFNANTQSSYAASCLSSTLSNFLIILVKKNSSTTLERAMTILKNKYMYTGRTKWIDADGISHSANLWNMIDVKKFVEEELLYKSSIETAISNASSDEITLPSYATVCYSGPGVQFEIDGTKYEMNKENLSLYRNAVLAGKHLKWTFSRNVAANKYGIAADKYIINVYLADNKGNIITDYKLEELKVAAGNG